MIVSFVCQPTRWFQSITVLTLCSLLTDGMFELGTSADFMCLCVYVYFFVYISHFLSIISLFCMRLSYIIKTYRVGQKNCTRLSLQ